MGPWNRICMFVSPLVGKTRTMELGPSPDIDAMCGSCPNSRKPQQSHWAKLLFSSSSPQYVLTNSKHRQVQLQPVMAILTVLAFLAMFPFLDLLHANTCICLKMRRSPERLGLRLASFKTKGGCSANTFAGLFTGRAAGELDFGKGVPPSPLGRTSYRTRAPICCFGRGNALGRGQIFGTHVGV